MRSHSDRPAVSRPRLVSPALLRVFAASFGGMASFHLLLSVVPLYATDGGAGEIGAGATTAALLLATVAAELVAPRLVARFGYRWTFGAGLLLLGAPALLLPASSALGVIVALSAVRGLGFGVVVVLGSALVAELVPPERRGEGLGVFGIVIGAPGVVALPSGVYLVGQVGYAAVLLAGGVLALTGLVTVPGLPDGRARRGQVRPHRRPAGVIAVSRAPWMRRPAVVFAFTAMAAGVVVTFVPLAVTGSANLAATALLVQAATAVAGRWWAGWYGDRTGPDRLIIPGLLVSAAGILALVLVPDPVAVVVFAVLFGTGFGITQNASLALMFSRARSHEYGAVSALWNLAFDAAMGLGAAGFGLLVTGAGYPAAFALTGAVMLLALAPARRDRMVAGAGTGGPTPAG
jgi:MFS family permease